MKKAFGSAWRRRLRLEPLESRTLLSAGSLDPSFGTLGALTADFGGAGGDLAGDTAAEVLIMPGDKVLLVGTAGPVEQTDFALARFNADGSPDLSFGPNHDGRVTTDFGGENGDFATAASLQPDGKILVAGVRINTGSGGGGDGGFEGPVVFLTTFDYDVCLARYQPNGSPDASFGTDGKAVWVSPTEPETFVRSVATLPNGDILLSFGQDLMRFSPTGTLKQTVDTAPFLDVALPPALSVLPGRKVLVAATKLARLNADLTLDRSFGGGDGVAPLGFHAGAVAASPDGRVTVVGGINDATGALVTSVARFTPAGQPDPTFGGGDGLATADFGPTADFARDFATLPDGSTLVTLGRMPFDFLPSDSSFAVARFSPAGLLDATFGEGGRLVVDRLADPSSANAVALDSRGRALVAGSAAGDFAAARLIVGPNPGTRTYEAEQARLTGAVVSRAHAGFTGSGFADFRNPSGDFAEWTVDAPSAGVYFVSFRYANASSSDRRPMRLTVDGRAPTTVTFPPTGAWTAWADTIAQPLSQPAGTSKIRLTATGRSGPNIDSMTLQPQVNRHEAEAATVSGAVVSRDHAGYTGAGYVDYQHARRDSVDWTIDAPADGFYLLEFDYANGSTKARTMQVSVNGLPVDSPIAFDRTASWSTWSTAGIHVAMKKGTNRIRLLATGQSGPNVDAMTVTLEDGSTS